jgi:glycine C-acetyltransferase
MQNSLRKQIAAKLEEIKIAGLYKPERVLDTPQQNRIRVRGGQKPVINLCANNYLALANDRNVINAAKQALDDWGYGLASARLICGTQTIHKELEGEISSFLGTEATILYPSCFDANAGLFETLLDAEDAVISDELNHASIIDGIRLSKAQRFRYRNGDMRDLEQKLQESGGARHRLIATDGVFSMDGYIAKLPEICDLAEKYGAVVMIDDSHAVGCVGANGRGTHEHHEVMGRVDIITGTLGKALGGASGGYTSGSREVVDLLRQRSRPYLFSQPRLPCLRCWQTLVTYENISRKTHGFSGVAWSHSASKSCPASIRSFQSCSEMRQLLAGWLNSCSRKESMSSHSRIPSFHKGKPESGCSCLLGTPKKIWNLRLRNSAKLDPKWVCDPSSREQLWIS